MCDLIRELEAAPQSKPYPPEPRRLGAGLRTNRVEQCEELERQPPAVKHLVAQVAEGRRPRAVTTECLAGAWAVHHWEHAGPGLFTVRTVTLPFAPAEPPAPPGAARGGSGWLSAAVALLLVGGTLGAAGFYFGREHGRPQAATAPDDRHWREVNTRIDALAATIARQPRVDPGAIEQLRIAVQQIPPQQPQSLPRTVRVTGTLQIDTEANGPQTTSLGGQPRSGSQPGPP